MSAMVAVSRSIGFAANAGLSVPKSNRAASKIRPILGILRFLLRFPAIKKRPESQGFGRHCLGQIVYDGVPGKYRTFPYLSKWSSKTGLFESNEVKHFFRLKIKAPLIPSLAPCIHQVT